MITTNAQVAAPLCLSPSTVGRNWPVERKNGHKSAQVEAQA